MSFADGFYSFSLTIADSDSERYEQLRLKVTKHPFESLEYLVGRVLAYAHCYEAGLEFSTGLYSPKDPTMWRKNVLEEILVWVDLGECDLERLLKVRRRWPEALVRQYVGNNEEEAVWHNQVSKHPVAATGTLECWRLDQSVIIALVGCLKLRNSWAINFVDGQVYVSVSGGEEGDDAAFQGAIEPIC